MNPHKKTKTKQKIQAKENPKNENQPINKIPQNQNKKPPTKIKAKPKQNCKENLCSLSFI